MRNLTISILTIVASVFTSSVAFAGETSTFNSYTTTNKYNGVSTTKVDAHLDSYTVETTLSESTKVESVADKGDTNIANVSYKNGEFSANATSFNGRPVDPVATIYVSTVKKDSVKTIAESADIDTFTKYQFTEHNFTHEVGNKY